MLGGASEAFAAVIGEYFEALGLAFQVRDDVINLRGFEGDRKVRGEDLAAGKVTYPIARAMRMLDTDERRWLADRLKADPADSAGTADACRLLEERGVLSACAASCERILEEAWSALDHQLPDSHAKLRLRAFSVYLLRF